VLTDKDSTLGSNWRELSFPSHLHGRILDPALLKVRNIRLVQVSVEEVEVDDGGKTLIPTAVKWISKECTNIQGEVAKVPEDASPKLVRELTLSFLSF
jgi:hypothetical protein